MCEKYRCLESPFMKNLLENMNEDGYYQTFQFKHHDRAETTITFNVLIWCDKVVDCIQIRFGGDRSRPIIDAANLVLNSHCWQLEIDKNEDLDLEFPKESNSGSSSESDEADHHFLRKLIQQ